MGRYGWLEGVRCGVEGRCGKRGVGRRYGVICLRCGIFIRLLGVGSL